MATKQAEKTVHIPQPNIKSAMVDIVGDAPLIFHKWSAKAKREILEKQMKKAQKGREVRNPEAEYRESFYLDSDGDISFPTLCLKQALTNAVRNVEGVTMTLIRGCVFFVGDKDGMVKVTHKGKALRPGKLKVFNEGETHPEYLYGADEMFPDVIQARTDMVRVGMGSADIRFRGQVKDWEMKLLVRYNEDVISLEQVLNLLQIAGFSCGLGEWRPEKSGDYGIFSLKK